MTSTETRFHAPRRVLHLAPEDYQVSLWWPESTQLDSPAPHLYTANKESGCPCRACSAVAGGQHALSRGSFGAKAVEERRYSYATGPLQTRKRSSFPLVNLLLFIATVFTTLLAGALFQKGLNVFANPALLAQGLPFAGPLLSILLAHEFGHYLASRKNGVKATLPYFIPAPHLFGTFGAFIKMQSPVTSRRALLEIGATGPIAGFAVAIPVVVLGLSMSEIRPATGEADIFFGTSLLFSLLTRATLGVTAADYDIVLHPVALAGWIGFFVTAINLLPAGQLDGGHILYALFTRHYRKVHKVLFVLLCTLGILLWYGWFVWVFLIVIFGLRHPPVLDQETSLDWKHKLLGVVAIVTLVLTFSPVPFRVAG